VATMVMQMHHNATLYIYTAYLFTSSVSSGIPEYSHKNENSKAGKLSTLNSDYHQRDINIDTKKNIISNGRG
jgi:hypothetical protein